MNWPSLNLWADEEKRIHQCLILALQKLIAKQIISFTHEEKEITGKLRPILRFVCKKRKLNWTFHSEASSFEKEDDSEPFGRTDMRFSGLDTEHNE